MIRRSRRYTLYRSKNMCYIRDNITDKLSPLFMWKSELFRYLRYQDTKVREFDAACEFIIDTGELDVETIKAITT